MDADETPAVSRRTRQRKLYHKKSRNGCLRCKERRVKCDEQHPVCANCQRHQAKCEYKVKPITAERPKSRLLSPFLGGISADSVSNSTPDENYLSFEESESRRLLELRLLSNLYANILDSESMPYFHHELAQRAISKGKPHLNLLYALMGLSASHMVRIGVTDPEIVTAMEVYLTLALQEQRKAISQLARDNAIEVCFAALYLMTNSIVQLQTRTIEQPYDPPMDWLQMGQGLQKVLVFIANEQSGPRKLPSKLDALFDTPSGLTDFDEIFSEENERDYMDLLRPRDMQLDRTYDERLHDWNNELLVEEDYVAYSKTIRYIGYLQKSILKKEPVQDFARRVLAFPMCIPKQFSELLGQRRIRALVIFAYFLAMMTKAESLWFIGDLGAREIRAIHEYIPQAWQNELRRPFKIAGLVFP